METPAVTFSLMLDSTCTSRWDVDLHTLSEPYCFLDAHMRCPDIYHTEYPDGSLSPRDCSTTDPGHPPSSLLCKHTCLTCPLLFTISVSLFVFFQGLEERGFFRFLVLGVEDNDLQHSDHGEWIFL